MKTKKASFPRTVIAFILVLGVTICFATSSTAATQPASTTSDAIAGTWQLDIPKTEEHLRNYATLQEMFGTGLSLGSELKITDTLKARFWIGIGSVYTGTLTEQSSGIYTTVIEDSEHLTATSEPIYWSQN